MSPRSAVAFALDHFEDADFRRLAVFDNFQNYRCASDMRRADVRIFIMDQKNLINRHRLAGLCVQKLGLKGFFFLHFYLFPADLNDCK